MDEPLSSELIARYLAGEANAEERAIVEHWAAADPANASDLEHMRTVWGTRPVRHLFDVDKAWKRVDARLDTSGKPAKRPTVRDRQQRVILQMAAALVLVAGLGLAWREFGTELMAPAVMYATGVGERRNVDLPDGTRVLIGPLTTISVDGRYGRALRRVDILGEAFFEVVHDTTQPFQVHAFGTITEDLGTAFSVRALAIDSVVQVVVAEGSASVRLADAPVSEGAVLKARDAVALDAKTLRAQVRREVEVNALLAWRTGRLEFTDAPLADIAVELERWYGIVVRFADERLRTRRISYNMPTNDLDDVLSVLRNWVDVEQSGDTLIVK